MADNSFTLVAQIADERTNANFIVAISTLKLIDFGLNERFQLDGTSQGAFDAFVHGGDFAAHCLSEGRNAITGYGFRLEQAHRRFRHAACCRMHFLRAFYELREAPEHGDRQCYTRNDAEAGGRGEKVLGGLQGRKDIRIDGFAQGDAASGPEHADCSCRPEKLRGVFRRTARSGDNRFFTAGIVIGRREGRGCNGGGGCNRCSGNRLADNRFGRGRCDLRSVGRLVLNVGRGL